MNEYEVGSQNVAESKCNESSRFVWKPCSGCADTGVTSSFPRVVTDELADDDISGSPYGVDAEDTAVAVDAFVSRDEVGLGLSCEVSRTDDRLPSGNFTVDLALYDPRTRAENGRRSDCVGVAFGETSTTNFGLQMAEVRSTCVSGWVFFFGLLKIEGLLVLGLSLGVDEEKKDENRRDLGRRVSQALNTLVFAGGEGGRTRSHVDVLARGSRD